MTGLPLMEWLTAITADDVIRLRGHIHIVHHVRGRLRVRLSTKVLGRSQGNQVEQFRRFVESLKGVRRLRMSALTGSAIVDYDQNDLSPQLWESLIEGPDEAVRCAFAALMRSARYS